MHKKYQTAQYLVLYHEKCVKSSMKLSKLYRIKMTHKTAFKPCTLALVGPDTIHIFTWPAISTITWDGVNRQCPEDMTQWNNATERQVLVKLWSSIFTNDRKIYLYFCFLFCLHRIRISFMVNVFVYVFVYFAVCKGLELVEWYPGQPSAAAL